MAKTAITPTRNEDYPQWYQQVINAADLAENSVVRGCMVIKPTGYALWEKIQSVLDTMIKDTGHENFYCPLFVPLSFLAKEAKHIDGFAKECAVVTHHRLEATEDGSLEPAGKLEEPLIVRPTSETIIGDLYSKWIKSHRDLPLLLNQWANIVRWEMRTRIFLRTSEFLWQEGHTAHATESEAKSHTLKMLDVYVKLVKDYMAMPIFFGKKTSREKFPGAVETYTLEAMMQDKKALQGGTSHYLGQSFSRAFDIKYQTKNETQEHVYTTSWGVTTRLIGSMIMVHGDDDGIIVPPKIAPTQVVIMPLTKKNQDLTEIINYCEDIKSKLEAQKYNGESIRVKIDNKDLRPGEKAWGWVKKGIPIRVEVGQKELEKNSVYVGLRTNGYKEKEGIDVGSFIVNIESMLGTIQETMYQKALEFMNNNTYEFNNKNDFERFFKDENSGFAIAPWADDEATEEWLKKTYKVTPRCIPSTYENQKAKCIFTGKDNCEFTLFARSY